MTKTLVTGASGLLGTEICRQLKQAGHEVWALDNHSRSESVPECDHFISLDIRDVESVRNLARDWDYIYHYSAINGTTNFYERPNEVLTNNFISDVIMFELAEECPNLKKIVYASTSEIVSDDPLCPTPEQVDVVINDIHNPRWSYRIGKIASENYLANSKIPWVTVRYFNIYGPRSRAGHFVADQLAKIGKGVFEIIGGDETRSFCYIEDAIAATIFCGDNVEKQVVNIGNDQETLVSDACRIVAESLGFHNAEWTETAGRPGSTKRRMPSIDKLRSLWPEYKPRSFREGMQKIVETLGLHS